MSGPGALPLKSGRLRGSGEWGEGLLVVPGHPAPDLRLDGLDVPDHGHHVVEGIGAVGHA